MQSGFKKRIDLTDARFGLLSVLRFAEMRGKNAHWHCRCDCGTESIVAGYNLRSGNSTSCGCARIRQITKHGHSRRLKNSPEYRAWISMVARCTKENVEGYKNYGGKGIKVCPEWSDFRCFLADVGHQPTPDHHLFRRNKRGNYEPGNCEWGIRPSPTKKSKRRAALSLGELITPGRRFGRLVALAPISRGARRPDHVGWKCHCQCGTDIVVNAYQLKAGRAVSCGCFAKEGLSVPAKSHGKSKLANYVMFYNARARAAAKDVPCTITPEDIAIPDKCPVLGIPMGWGMGRDSLPSLDRVVPLEGYTPGNIRVISWRANRLKSDASIADLRLLLAYLEKHNG